MGEFDFTEVYKITSELVSAICFASGMKVKLGEGLINEVPMDIPIEQMNMHVFEQREISIFERQETIYTISLLRNDIQSFIVKLFRHAFSVNDHFTKLLFYWHTLVYPSNTDKDGITYVDQNLLFIDEHMHPYLDTIKKSPMLSKSGAIDSMGEYVYKNVRNSIAHIVRTGSDYVNLELDNVNEIRHISSIAHILESLCRQRIKQDFEVQIGNDPEIFCVY